MTTLRGIRDPNKIDDANVRQILQAMKDNIEELGGNTTDQTRHAARFQDLIDAELITIDENGNIVRVPETEVAGFEDDTAIETDDSGTLVGSFDASSGQDVGIISTGIGIPSGAVIYRAFIDVITPFASGGTPTIGLGIETDGQFDLIPASIFSGAPWSTIGYKDTTSDGAIGNFTPVSPRKTAGVRNIIVTVGGTPVTDSLTNGRMNVVVQYVRSL